MCSIRLVVLLHFIVICSQANSLRNDSTRIWTHTCMTSEQKLTWPHSRLIACVMAVVLGVFQSSNNLCYMSNAKIHCVYSCPEMKVLFHYIVPSKAVCCEIGPAFWKSGSTDFVKMSKKDAFSWEFSPFLAEANDFGTRTPPPILSNLVELA